MPVNTTRRCGVLKAQLARDQARFQFFFGVKFHHVAPGCALTIMMTLTPNGPGNSEFQREEIHFRNFSWDILMAKKRHLLR